MASLDLLILQKLETGTSPHGIFEFADSTKTGKSAKLELHNTVSVELPCLWTSILKKNCLIHVQFYSFKDSRK